MITHTKGGKRENYSKYKNHYISTLTTELQKGCKFSHLHCYVFQAPCESSYWMTVVEPNQSQQLIIAVFHCHWPIRTQGF